MRRIVSLTANLLAERTFEFDAWRPGETQRARRESFQVGGKGINVAKLLARLGVPHEAVLFPGGETGRECLRWLEASGIRHRAFAHERPTRTGLVVRAPGEAETTFLGPDTPVPPEAIDAAGAWLAAEPADTVLALCGSVPGWDGPSGEAWRRLLGQWLQAGRWLAADTYGPALDWLARRAVHLVKINAREFAGWAGGPAAERLSPAAAGSPVRAWIITDGPGPVHWLKRGSHPARRMPPPVAEVSPTGSGDVLLAAVLHGLHHRGLSLAEAVDFALPLAAANAAHPGIAEFSMNI